MTDNLLSDHPNSYYTATANHSLELTSLSGHATCDICIIGGGFTGLSAALNLAETGHRVILIEAHRIAWGASGRNGGQVWTGHHWDQHRLEANFGQATAKQLWALSEEGKKIIQTRIKKHHIDCDYRPGILQVACKISHAIYFAENTRKLNDEYDYPMQFLSREQLFKYLGTEIYHGGELDWGAGHFHPLNYALGLAKAAGEAGAVLYEKTPVLSINSSKRLIRTTRGHNIQAKDIIIACNGYLDKLCPTIAGNIMPINNFIVATEPLGDRATDIIRKNVAVADSNFVVNYYRLTTDKRLLFGGGENYRRRFPKDIKALVKKHMLGVFPQLRDVGIDYAWGGTLAITMNRLPDIGKIGHHIYYAQGYSGQGVALANLVGQLIGEAINGEPERFELMTRLSTRRFPGGTLLRWPGMLAGMLYYKMSDKWGR